MKKLFLGLFGCITASLNASFCTEWDYGWAIRSAQGGQWVDAQQRMSRLMVHDPDNPELLYDNGVAAYHLKEYQKAHAYFQQTTQSEQTDVVLKEKAYFNVGNANVALNKLEEAIDAYESALKIDPQDEHARYNLEKVRELLKQQKQQQDNKQENNNQENKEEQRNKEQEKEGEQQQQNNRSKSEQASQQKQQDQAGADHQKQGGEQQQSPKGQNNRSDDNEQQQQEADQQQEGDRPGDAGEKSEGDSRNQKQDQFHDSHDTSTQANSQRNKRSGAHNIEDHHTREVEKSQEMQSNALDEQEGGEAKQVVGSKKVEAEFAPHEQWMARLLRQREQADEKANKQIVKTMIDKELAGKDGQNCW